MTELRLISFLPSATKMVFALGLGDRLVGVSHECDFPAAAKTKPVVVKPVLPLEKMSLREIDAAVAERIGSGQNIYQVDERLLEQLAPTHILTQDLCQVCAPSGNEITRALAALPVKPKILWFTPHSIGEIFANIRELGASSGRMSQAEELSAVADARLQNVVELTKKRLADHAFSALNGLILITVAAIGCRKWLNLPAAKMHWDAKARTPSAFRGPTLPACRRRF
jgi:iron complex transport system substrate-binding protein